MQSAVALVPIMEAMETLSASPRTSKVLSQGKHEGAMMNGNKTWSLSLPTLWNGCLGKPQAPAGEEQSAGTIWLLFEALVSHQHYSVLQRQVLF